MRTMVQPEEHIDTEITLGMTSLLGIFFGLVLICGVFFGFGYSLGRHSPNEPQTSASSAAPATDESASATAARAKPSAQLALPAQQSADPGLPAAPPTDSAASSGNSTANESLSAVPTRPTPRLVSDAAPAARPQTQPELKPAVITPPSATQRAIRTLPVPSSLATALPSAGSPTMVQIAAVSRQEDADVLVSALKSHGFNVTVRNESQDRLLHVQIGPFTSRDQAKSMRQKLLEAGYNAILKP